MAPWTPFPHAGEFRHDAASLPRLWDRLHGGDAEPLPKDEAVLAAAIRQGIGMPYGCKDGACGSCKCKLVTGQVQQSNFQRKALSEDEEAQGFVIKNVKTNFM